MQLELLSPAKNLEQGREAINHGADAVYIGAPAFGARTAAGNSIEDIESLTHYAHLYHAKIFATVNTLLFDNEIDDAVKMLHQLYNAGVDAAIIQDLGLLECDLPPIELHASTQTHNASLPRIQFLEKVGFSRIILARETSLQQMEEIRRHSAAQHLRQMVDAGITSFKIEGRLKDLGYVKNVTAYYRRLLDDIIEGTEHTQSSSGHCEFHFVPDLEKTFNRGFTDYFLEKRQPMATLSTQKSIGKRIGTVKRIEHNCITIDSSEPLTAGDGLCFMNNQGTWEGFLVNRVERNTIYPNRMPASLKVGTPIWRNNDQAFERLLQSNTSSRKIDIQMELSDTDDGLCLRLTDCDGCQASATIACFKERAQNPDKAIEQTRRQLSKLGDTIFRATHIDIDCQQPYFLPASTLNELRRQTVTQLQEVRVAQHLSLRGTSPSLDERQQNTTLYFEPTIDYHANVINEQSRQFYIRHGAETIEYGLEKSLDYHDKALMTTCLRFISAMASRRPCCSKERTIISFNSSKGSSCLRSFTRMIW